MRIVIDLQGAQTESRFRGIGRYTLSLAQAIACNRGTHEVLIALNGAFAETIKPIQDMFEGLLPRENLRIWSAPGPVRDCVEANFWRREAAERIREAFFAGLQPDVIYVSSLFEGFLDNAVTSIGIFDRETPVFATLYDLIPLKNPGEYFRHNPNYEKHYRRKIESFKRAQGWLGISNHAVNEARELLGTDVTDKKQLVNVYTACDDRFRILEIEAEKRKNLLQSYGIDKHFIMYTGTSDPRKNLNRLIKAYAQIDAQIRGHYQLVLVGKFPEEQIRSFKFVAGKAGLNPEEVVFTGYVSDDTLVRLYNLCTLFVFPSVDEGFGLPPLEAMMCGAPTIASNTSSLPEVVCWEEATFDPRSIEEMSAKIVRALTDDNFRRELIARGAAQSRKFSWNKCAKRVIKAFEQNCGKAKAISVRWAEYLNRRETLYGELVDSLAEISADNAGPDDSDLRSAAKSIAENLLDTDRFVRRKPLPEKLTWRIEGPFDSSYSLSITNREMARAIKSIGHQVALHSTEGLGDFIPERAFLTANSDLAKMFERAASAPPEAADVTSRMLFPPRVQDMRCRINMLHAFAWEESGLPFAWAESFSEHLQGIACISRHVEKILIDHGVTTPLAVAGIGADHWENVIPDRNYKINAKGFRFLHVSSCFPRKGVDSLLKAYGKAFSRRDDVTLIVKTFPNPHNEIHRWHSEAKLDHPEYPDVLIIEEDLTDTELKSLYIQCHSMVAPSRAEGLGLPLAEAMLSELPVIATGWGGHLDFCKKSNAWLVDYDFAAANSHFNLFDSTWAEPDVEHLAETMREVYETPQDERKEKAHKGRSFLIENYPWKKVAGSLVDLAGKCALFTEKPEVNIGWITTWNTPCGIAFYSSHLIANHSSPVTVLAARCHQQLSPDDARTFRCWSPGEADMLRDLEETIAQHDINTIVVQFNYGFFNFGHLSRFLTRQLDRGKTVVVTMHATQDPSHAPIKKLVELKAVLSKCHRILVHSIHDLNRLKDMGLIDNVVLFPHGIPDFTLPDIHGPDSASQTFHMASYGFFLPHKGLLELIEAVKMIRENGLDVQLQMINAEYPVSDSSELIKKARRMVKDLGLNRHVEIIPEFLPDEKCLELLSRNDLIAFPYQQTSESSSAAVRYGLASGKPVAVTPLDIFDDVAEAVFYLPGNSPERIAEGLTQLLGDVAANRNYVWNKAKEADRWRSAHRYSLLGSRLNNMLIALRRKCCKQ